MAFTLTSTDIHDGGVLPDAQVADKGNTSPQLSWSGAPEGAKSYAITVYDPDAPTGSGFWHWTVANIPADVTQLADWRTRFRQARSRAERTMDRRVSAGPPRLRVMGPHRYIFTVFAVDTDKLDVTPDNSGAVFGFNLHFHTLARATITATYENKA
jgi:Raf kinase inhibitor-like YbhB/YbcL family protein